MEFINWREGTDEEEEEDNVFIATAISSESSLTSQLSVAANVISPSFEVWSERNTKMAFSKEGRSKGVKFSEDMFDFIVYSVLFVWKALRRKEKFYRLVCLLSLFFASICNDYWLFCVCSEIKWSGFFSFWFISQFCLLYQHWGIAHSDFKIRPPSPTHLIIQTENSQSIFFSWDFWIFSIKSVFLC